MRVPTCKTKHWELCKSTDHLIRRYFIKTVHFVYTGGTIFDKSNHEQSAKWAKLYEVQRISELYERRSWYVCCTFIFLIFSCLTHLNERLIIMYYVISVSLRWESPKKIFESTLKSCKVFFFLVDKSIFKGELWLKMNLWSNNTLGPSRLFSDATFTPDAYALFIHDEGCPVHAHSHIALANKKCLSQFNPIHSFMWTIRRMIFRSLWRKNSRPQHTLVKSLVDAYFLCVLWPYFRNFLFFFNNHA